MQRGWEGSGGGFICTQATVSRGRFQRGIDGGAAGKLTVSDTGSHVAGHVKCPHTHMHG